MTRDLERVGRRGLQYWYDDGLVEMAVGCLSVALGLLFLAEAFAPRGSLPVSFVLLVLVAGGVLISNWVVKVLKGRITYPRTGFVQYHRPPRSAPRRVLVGVLAATVSGFVAVGLTSKAPASLVWIPAMQSVLIGLSLLYLGYSVGLGRFYALAAASLALGAGVSALGLGDALGNGVYFLSMGLLALVSGGITLRRYLQSTRPPEGV